MTGLHHLKTWPAAFNQVASGDKTFEWRKADRNFEEGDVVSLHEWDPATEQYTGRCITADVGCVLRAPDFGVPDGYCVFSLIDVGDVSRGSPPDKSEGYEDPEPSRRPGSSAPEDPAADRRSPRR